MRALVCLMFLALGACSSPSPQFLGVAPVTVMVEGWRIDVYAKDGRAEAIRMTKDWAQTKDLMRERGVIAVEQATGWLVDRRTISGDGALVRMRARAPRSGPAARSGAETDPPA